MNTQPLIILQNTDLGSDVIHRDTDPGSDIILELFSAIDSSDWASLKQLFHREIVYERPGYDPFNGLDRVMEFYQKERILACGEHLLEKIVLSEGHGACWGRFIGFRKDGSEVNERFADVYSFKEGRIRTRRSYFFRPAV
jgi:ketosteroid isomerase-like protein